MVPIDNGTELTHTYLDLYQRTSERQRSLLKSYYFLCNCSRCTEKKLDKELTGFVCKTDNCNGILYVGSSGDYSTENYIINILRKLFRRNRS